MSTRYRIPVTKQQEAQAIAQQLAHRLELCLEPLLICLDAYLDKRLVRTLVTSLVAIIEFRNRAQGLYLSELGAYILSPAHAPAGTKRLSHLLSSTKWGKDLIER